MISLRKASSSRSASSDDGRLRNRSAAKKHPKFGVWDAHDVIGRVFELVNERFSIFLLRHGRHRMYAMAINHLRMHPNLSPAHTATP